MCAVNAIGDGPWSSATRTDYDTDNDGLIDVSNLAQLNAIRWDLGRGRVFLKPRLRLRLP